MAEYNDFIKQQKRMCQTVETCDKCPLLSMKRDCRFMAMIDADYDAVEIEAIVQIVMDWAKENPEPRYPTWTEWQKETFPDAENGICPETFMSSERSGCVNYGDCTDCLNQPIPADIAEKLGIKPVGGMTDEDA